MRSFPARAPCPQTDQPRARTRLRPSTSVPDIHPENPSPSPRRRRETRCAGVTWAGRGDQPKSLLHIAFLVYVVAMATDFLDGYLARKWKVEGAFGRVVDPFVDKVLVLGSFAFFAGKNFVIPESMQNISPSMVAKPITGVVPAMVVIIMARE